MIKIKFVSQNKEIMKVYENWFLTVFSRYSSGQFSPVQFFPGQFWYSPRKHNKK